MQYTTLSNGVKMPMLGYGVFQIGNAETEECVAQAIKAGYRQRDWTALHDGPLLRNRSCGGGPMATSDPSSQAYGLALITLQST